MKTGLATQESPTRTGLVVITVVALVTAAFAPTLGDYFLSDDFSYVYQLAEQHGNGQLLSDVASQFTRGLTSGSDFYYRPLTYASFALDYLVHGASPFGFRLTNLLLHAANAGMVAALFIVIASRLGLGPANFGALLAGLLFGLAPSSLEVAAWVSGRFDALATFFLLLSLLLFVRKDRWRHLGAAALAMALMSKESAVLAVVYAGLIALVLQPLAASNATWRERIRQAARLMLPFVIIITAYFVWRWYIFGTPFKVYANSNSLPNLVSGAWLRTMGSFPDWFRALTDDSLLSRVMLAGVVASILLSLRAAMRHTGARCMILLCGAALLIAYALVFSNNPGFASDGQHGRLFYQMLIPASWLLALPLAMLQPPHSALAPAMSRMLKSLPIVASVLLLATASLLGLAA
ncbi:MAG: hypothetical protein JNN20_01280, partial [Betaproteobacteria bacterium]|nr:hypothetical protein [Betaproteobacteria bacterium]